MTTHNAMFLQDIMRNSTVDIRLQKKAVQMVTDLADSQLENEVPSELPLFRSHIFLKSVINLLSSSDADLQEKVGPTFFSDLSPSCNG